MKIMNFEFTLTKMSDYWDKGWGKGNLPSLFYMVVEVTLLGVLLKFKTYKGLPTKMWTYLHNKNSMKSYAGLMS